MHANQSKILRKEGRSMKRMSNVSFCGDKERREQIR
jgi:hypothetical protein